MHPYERWILRRYLANALRASRFARPPRRDKDIAAWIESHARLLGLPELALGTGSSRRSRGLDEPINSASWRAFRVATIVAAREPCYRRRNSSFSTIPVDCGHMPPAICSG